MEAARSDKSGPPADEAAAAAPRLLTIRQSMPLVFGVAAGMGMLAFYVTALVRGVMSGAGPNALTVVFQLTFTFVASFGAVMVGFLAWGALAWLGIATTRRVGRGTLVGVAVVALVAGIVAAALQ